MLPGIAIIKKHLMFRKRRLYSFVILLLIGSSIALISQNTGRSATALIHDRVDENKLVTLAGNTRPEANPKNDLGAVADSLSMDHMMLQLKRSPEREQMAAQFVADLHNPKSPNFHKWLTSAEFGKNYGLADSDIQTITGWLESHGFTVNAVYPSGMVIDFSGSAGQVHRAFHTSIHNLDVDGVRHIANVSDPQIPSALAPAVAGVVSLHDFMPHKLIRPAYTFTYERQTTYAVVPADLATIYDFNPLLSKGVTGSGQTIVVLEDTDLYSSLDWTNFRKAFGLSQYSSGSLTTQHPSSSANNCSDPGVTGADDEAILDAEWSSAAAPGAAIIVGTCADSNIFGGFIAMQNLINGSSPPQVVSISYASCEAESGVSLNAFVNSLYQQAVMEGVSVFTAAGDWGAAACDAGFASATHGISINGYASTPYNVAVGGTDFADVLTGTTGTYWSRTNGTTYGSAQSYIPEIPWNNSCANSLYANYVGFSTTYGANGYCNSNAAQAAGYVSVTAGGGGPSNCATGSSSQFGVANGSCQGYAKPAWQTGLSGIPSDGVRDTPDVSMFASNGPMWGHYAVVCFTDENNGGGPCTGAPSGWGGAGGTSLATPIMAGIQALVNQKVGGAQGNPNYVYYALAASTPSVFHNVSQGDIDVPCGGSANCFGILGTVDYGRGGRVFQTTWGGALSVSSTSFTPAYTAGSAWNFATGIGSVDVNNLVTNWISAQ
jgi:subtilase family serine protease